MTELIMAVHSIIVFPVLVSVSCIGINTCTVVLVKTFNSSWYVFQVLVISGPTYMQIWSH